MCLKLLQLAWHRTKSDLDTVRSLGQSYDGIIRKLVKLWKEKKEAATVTILKVR